MLPLFFKKSSLGFALVAAALLTGCASIKKYSVNSYPGMLPVSEIVHLSDPSETK